MELNNIIFSVLLILFVFFLSKSFLRIFNKTEFKILKDDQFNKPQAFHESEVLIGGGIGIFFSFLIIICSKICIRWLYLAEHSSMWYSNNSSNICG